MEVNWIHPMTRSGTVTAQGMKFCQGHATCLWNLCRLFCLGCQSPPICCSKKVRVILSQQDDMANTEMRFKLFDEVFVCPVYVYALKLQSSLFFIGQPHVQRVL